MDLGFDLGPKVPPPDEAIIKPHGIAIALQHLGQMLGGLAVLAFIGNENIGHAQSGPGSRSKPLSFIYRNVGAKWSGGDTTGRGMVRPDKPSLLICP
jgi:hypothetical protein